MSKQWLTQTAGGVWGIIGTFLIYRGALLYQMAAQEQNSSPQAITVSLVLALLLGLIKGRFILSKIARRNRNRISQLEAPLKAHHVFSGSFDRNCVAYVVLRMLCCVCRVAYVLLRMLCCVAYVVLRMLCCVCCVAYCRVLCICVCAFGRI